MCWYLPCVLYKYLYGEWLPCLEETDADKARFKLRQRAMAKAALITANKAKNNGDYSDDSDDWYDSDDSYFDDY